MAIIENGGFTLSEDTTLSAGQKIIREKVCAPLFELQSPTRKEVEESDLMFRVLSFANYTGDNEYELALAGWSGTDHENIIFCDNCYAQAMDTYGADNVLHLHKLISPDCDFVKYVAITDDIRNDVDTKEMLSRCRIENFYY